MLVILVISLIFLALTIVAAVIFGIPCLIGTLVDSAEEGSSGSWVAILLIIANIAALIISIVNLI